MEQVYLLLALESPFPLLERSSVPALPDAVKPLTCQAGPCWEAEECRSRQSERIRRGKQFRFYRYRSVTGPKYERRCL